MAAHLKRPPPPGTGRLVVAALAGILLSVLLTTPTSRAAFVATTDNAANAAAAAACFYAPTVQSGTASNTANGTQTITISSVDPAKAFLLFSTAHSSNRPVGSVLGGQIASATTIEFNRVTDEGSPSAIDIQWYVVEYSCGVSVQRGTVSQSATTVNVAITPVAALSQAFATYSKTVDAADASWNGNDPVLVDLTSTSNLQLRTDEAASGHTIYWQVVEFTDPTMISVQRGTTTAMTSPTTTINVTLPTAVDTTASFAIVSSRDSMASTFVDESVLRTRLLSSTTLEIARLFTDNQVSEISWQVVELSDGTSVQHLNTLLSTGVATSTVSIAAVDLSRATAFASSQNGAGLSGGRTPYFSDDILGVASATFAFSSTTQVSVDRNTTVDFGSFGWHVVEWGN